MYACAQMLQCLQASQDSGLTQDPSHSEPLWSSGGPYQALLSSALGQQHLDTNDSDGCEDGVMKVMLMVEVQAFV